MPVFTVSTDPGQLDFGYIHHFLSRQSYWARGISSDTLRKAMQHSLCFGGYYQGRQVAFARVVTDYATFAYVRDVFVDPAMRRRGFGKKLLHAIVQHADMQSLTMLLHTNDAQGFYRQFGFYQPAMPQRQMLRSAHKNSIARIA